MVRTLSIEVPLSIAWNFSNGKGETLPVDSSQGSCATTLVVMTEAAIADAIQFIISAPNDQVQPRRCGSADIGWSELLYAYTLWLDTKIFIDIEHHIHITPHAIPD